MISFRFRLSPPLLPALAIAALSLVSSAFAADWPPILDEKNPTTQANDGRLIERYIHGPREAWGYPAGTEGEWAYPKAQETAAAQQNHSSFYVVTPKNPRENAPLCVVLHSANRTAYDYLGFACLDRKIDGGDDPATTMTNPPDDFYGLFLNSTNAEWWGWTQARLNAAKQINGPTAAELRVLDTIEWVVNRYHIDRTRIYLCGVSMGGCGTLGIGLPHGEIFAAIRATVPAGTGYASYRLGGFAPSPAFDATPAERDAWQKHAAMAGLNDPPVVVDFSSQQDGWATTQPALVQAAQAGKLPLILTWGPFGHATFGSSIAKSPMCQAGLAFPWLEIRKNEAYPVFTHATSDQRCPWLNTPAVYDDSGQMNACFRWKVVEDTPSAFSIQLWIDRPPVKDGLATPETARADVTLRRLQQFKIKAGQKYVLRLFQREKKPDEFASETSDDTGLLSIPQVLISRTPSTLSLLPPNQ